MELDNVVKVVEQLVLGNIPLCIVGELALNYYNVPRAVHVGYELSVFEKGPYTKGPPGY
jgi:hypothetical protein